MRICCPVCGEALQQQKPAWHCPSGHSFDVARQGYVNLLPVTQKHSRHPGDTREMVAARKEFLDGGFYRPIVQTVAELLKNEPLCQVLDAGCGEGYYLTELAARFAILEPVGVDISKDAVRYAAVRNPGAIWLTATASRLPFADASFDAVLCMFAQTAAAEFRRVLRPGGVFLQVLAGPEHLMGLKRIIYPQILQKEKVLQASYPGFMLEKSQMLEFSFHLAENRQVRNLLAMTPHVWRIGKQAAERAAGLPELSDTAQVIFNVYRAESIYTPAPA